MSVNFRSSSLIAWSVVAFGFLALALAFSTRATLGLVMPVWTQELGWSRSFVSSAAAVALLVMAVVAPFAGRMIDRKGVRTTLVAGLALIGSGSVIVAATSSRLVFLLAFSGVAAVGFGMVATHVVSTAIARSFDRHRGLATGIATAGATGGQLVVVPLVAAILASSSWRWSFLALGAATLALLPLLWATLPKHVVIEKAGPGTAPLLTDIRFVLKKPAFHVLFWSFLLCGYTTAGVIETHFLSYAAFCGFGPLLGATAYGLLSTVNMGGMVLSGWLSDRVNRIALLSVIYLMRAIAFVILMRVGVDYDRLIAFAALFGAVDYATVPVTASLAASHIGLRVMGLSMGLISAGHAIGAAAGAFLGGYLFDLTFRYDWVWLGSAALTATAGLIVFVLRDRPRVATADAA
ncbi:Predicted arabinose efflux permease, MFS family [Enhydrobacter aerosaccus]|uniref:Predicted arabinose efflux permease, MFS family n=1 Tax=Enhydrobacter aerosaccus TaxID=225324 RepID=A0A1T4T550_9HYPH|nr:MFS transporter [Enhydrobacter aerosaccus]SKA35572.1 Predicted arabinose efflux permease, MFS family [Enhydrobacter aerosaccus]